MAPPKEPLPPGLKYVHHLYGDRSSTSRNGEYHFEWTPFTPAVLAWQSAERYLTQARNHLSEVSDLKSFAIPGLDVEFREFKAVLEVLIGDVEARAGEAKRVHQALDAANAEYAKANEFSHEEYDRVMRHVNDAAREQGRRFPAVAVAPHPGDAFGPEDRRLPFPQPTGIGSDHGN